MKQTFCFTISILFILLFPISMYAVEGMSKDEINVREEHDMLDKTAATPFEIRREKFREFEEKYSVYPEDRLRSLHEENCQTKWGSSDSPECTAIASQKRKKKFDNGGLDQ